MQRGRPILLALALVAGLLLIKPIFSFLKNLRQPYRRPNHTAPFQRQPLARADRRVANSPPPSPTTARSDMGLPSRLAPSPRTASQQAAHNAAAAAAYDATQAATPRPVPARNALPNPNDTRLLKLLQRQSKAWRNKLGQAVSQASGLGKAKATLLWKVQPSRGMIQVTMGIRWSKRLGASRGFLVLIWHLTHDRHVRAHIKRNTQPRLAVPSYISSKELERLNHQLALFRYRWHKRKPTARVLPLKAQ